MLTKFCPILTTLVDIGEWIPLLLKFVFSRKATKFTKSLPSIWHLLHNVNSTITASLIVVAFLENVNFKRENLHTIDISGTTSLEVPTSSCQHRYSKNVPFNKHFFFCCRRSPTQRIYPTFWTCLLPTHHLRRTGSKIGFGASKTKLNPPWWLYRRLTWCRWLWH